ncbi:amidase signature enzyme [Cyathus striatus]|nr:amidase signature enzyme [Cyathus striatus]
MSVVSLVVKDENPVSEDTVHNLALEINDGMVFSNPQDVKDYTILLAAFHESAQTVLELDDYVPGALKPDFTRFPRETVSFPRTGTSENALGGWACKVIIQDKQQDSARKGLLYGKSIVMKDCIAVAGVPCTLGSDAIDPPWVPSIDAVIVKRVLEAGATIVGKATTESMCQSASSFTSCTGPVDNPYAPGRTTGGSSSGCAALVASNGADMAIGTDQGGSVRMPCSFCGLVGLKPTFGLIPYTGIASNEWQHDYTGPLCKTVYDTALLLQVLAGTDGIDDRAGPDCPHPRDVPPYSENLELPGIQLLKGKKIGILKEAFEMPALDSRVAEKVKAAAALFEDLGAVVEEISIPLHSIAPTLWMVANRCVGGRTRLGQQAGHYQYYMNDLHNMLFPLKQQSWEKFIPATKNSQLNAMYAWKTSPGLYGKTMNKIMELKYSYDQALELVDCLILPTVSFVANTHPAPGSTALQQIMKSVGQGINCCPFNATGHPALSIPIGTLPPPESELITPGDINLKLPVGMQMVGKWWGEQGLLQLAAAWEKAYDWTTH